MPDLADASCIHSIADLRYNEPLARAEWLCADCGRVFAYIDAALVSDAAKFETWAASVGIPLRTVQRFLIGAPQH